LAKRKTHEEFMRDFKDKNPELFNSVEVVGKYDGGKNRILIKDSYGEMNVIAEKLLTSKKMNIKNCSNKTEYFKSRIKKMYDIDVYGNYKGSTSIFWMKDEYGWKYQRAERLLNAEFPTIKNAYDKTGYFINQCKKIHGNRYDYSLVEYSGYKNKVKIICKKHGIFEQRAGSHLNLRHGCQECARDLGKRTHNQAVKEIRHVNPNLEILSKYKGHNEKMLVKDEFGVLNISFNSIIEYNISIASTIDKTSYFKNVLKKRHPKMIDEIKIIGKYKKWDEPIIVETKYGKCKTIPNQLMNGSIPTILSAVDKTEYCINQFREKHGDRYEYDFKYEDNNQKIDIYCKKHGIFSQTIYNHKQGQNCPNCTKDLYIEGTARDNWISRANGRDAIVYIIKCYNINEEFYKIGITFTGLKKRFGNKRQMPYSYESIYEISGSPEYCYDLELELHDYHKHFSYEPLIYFQGETECFTHIDKNHIQEIIDDN
jgi:hypothetical protein